MWQFWYNSWDISTMFMICVAVRFKAGAESGSRVIDRPGDETPSFLETVNCLTFHSHRTWHSNQLEIIRFTCQLDTATWFLPSINKVGGTSMQNVSG